MKRDVLYALRPMGPRPLVVSRPYSSLGERLHQELTSRRLPLMFDYLSTQPSHLLSLTLVNLLPGSQGSSTIHTALPSVNRAFCLPAGHHLVYFPPQVTLSQLLPDGTDVLHSPGEPFNRRLWAGGRVRFPLKRGLALNGSRAVCIETIRDVITKGREGEEKVIVRIERRIGTVQENEDEHSIRERIWNGNADETGYSAVIEDRDLVFMREKAPDDLTRDRANFGSDRRIVKRYPSLLVHGPLTLTLLLTVLSNHLSNIGRVITEIRYRNLAPLYVREALAICGKPKTSESDTVWDIWIETGNGSLAVRGTIHTTTVVLTLLTFTQSALVYGGLISSKHVLFHPGLVFKIFPEVWRLFTPFLLTGPRFDLIFDLYFLYQYGSALETGSPRFGLPGDFLMYLSFIATTILGTAVSCTYILILVAMIIALVYTFSLENRGRKATFFVIQIPVELLPWAMLTWTLVVAGWPAAFSQSMGVVAGHLYEFLSHIYPTFGGGGRNYIATPAFVRGIFSTHTARRRSRSSGTAYRPNTQDQNPSRAWSSSLQNSWSSRGPGRRLGSQ
ncbi:DER1-domain-containing protein [Aspergillus avenaceus]|uniref:DER1-domain-containing protein n=1 Tax=Aspergillus avenaceus TaxID=36643 RepID=A0A5N6TPK7_ASPAV|nr:DER1-domain-containing protein [Aspergillus avenaceus]